MEEEKETVDLMELRYMRELPGVLAGSLVSVVIGLILAVWAGLVYRITDGRWDDLLLGLLGMAMASFGAKTFGSNLGSSVRELSTWLGVIHTNTRSKKDPEDFPHEG
jgi:hypothetical protein